MSDSRDVFLILSCMVGWIEGFLSAMEFQSNEIPKKSEEFSTHHKDSMPIVCNQSSRQLLQIIQSALKSQENEQALCEKIGTLLAQEAQLINACSDSGETPLLLVVRADREYLDLIKLLLARGAQINAVNNKGITALAIAIAKRRVATCALLLSQGAAGPVPHSQIKDLLDSIVQPAHKEGWKKSTEIVCLLLSYGLIQVDLHDVLWTKAFPLVLPTPLLQAIVTNKYAQAARILGQPEGLLTNFYRRAKAFLADEDSTIVIESPDTRDEHGAPALLYAVGGGNVAMVELLIALGANPFSADRWGMTPLALAKVRQADSHLTRQQREAYAKIKSILAIAQKKLTRLLTSLSHQGNLPVEIMVLMAEYLAISRADF